MSPRASLLLSRFFFFLAVVLFAAAGWLWWHDRPPASVLRVDGPIELGAIAAAADHPLEIPVANIGREEIRLAGLDGELC